MTLDFEQTFLNKLKDLANSEWVEYNNRTGIRCFNDHGFSIKINTQEDFPLIKSRKVYTKSIIRELLWFLKGSSNVKDLHPTKIWDSWAKEDGSVGPMYGVQWRRYAGYLDQIANVLHILRKDPSSRRAFFTSNNPSLLSSMVLNPCHGLHTQLTIQGDYLHMATVQRSMDMPVGAVFNYPSYAILLTLFAHALNKQPGDLYYTAINVHVYENQLESLGKQFKQYTEITNPVKPRLKILDYSLPSILEEFDEEEVDSDLIKAWEDNLEIVDYFPQPAIKFNVAI